MSEPKENKYGVKRAFAKPKAYTPESWWETFVNYLEYQEKKVWNKKEAIKSGEMAGTVMDIPISAPLSIRSFCVFADVSLQTFYNYEKGESYDKYFEVTRKMRTIIESEQLEGATIGAYNQNIVARLIGLSEKKEIEVTEFPKFIIKKDEVK